MRSKYCPICGRKRNDDGNCENDFCNKHNYQHFKSLIKYFGFDPTKYGTPDAEAEFYRVRNMLYDLYWNKGLSSTDLAKKFNYPSTPTNITQKFFKNYLSIPVKSVKYSTIENYFNGKCANTNSNQYKSEWHTTWNGKEVYLRSSYESDYAAELDNKRIDYEVESLRIKYFDRNKNEYRCAIPDFYLPETNTIVEIKSEWTLDIHEMLDKKKAYLEQGYNFKLILEHKETEI